MPPHVHLPFARKDIEGDIPALFQQAVALHAERPALWTEHERWTYAELDARTGRIAAALLERISVHAFGAGLLLDQGAGSAAATLGVLKAGGYYVPLDTGHPAERSRRMLIASEAHVLITVRAHARLAMRLAGGNIPILFLDDPEPEQRAPAPAQHVGPDAPAYIFFTSGSTGRPKGVVDTHRNVLHNVMRYSNALRVTADDRLTMIQSPVFSGTVSSLFTALLNGATLLPIDLRREGLTRTADLIKRSGATIYHSVPSIFRAIADVAGRLEHLRIVRLEGDRAGREDVERFLDACNDDCLLAHGLGATETGLSSQWIATKHELRNAGDLSLGAPLPDFSLRIVDEAGAAVAAGAIGELEVHSPYLAQGYWRDEERTAQRFLPDADKPGVRRYRTGDLARFDEAGRLHYIGRADLENKINGQRVDTAEVEEALMAMGLFQQVVVITRQDNGSDPQLVAYVVPKPRASFTLPHVRTALGAELPDYAIPTALVTLTAIPLTEHGKSDRQALPPPPSGPVAHTTEGLDEEQRVMIALWERTLNKRGIGLRDNFFALGGDSLRAAVLMSHVEKALQRRISPTALLEAPTVETFLQRLRGGPGAANSSLVVTLRATGDRPPIFLVDWPDGDGWLYGRLSQELGEDQPFHIIRSSGLPGIWPESTTMADLAQAVATAVLGALPTGDTRYILAGDCYGGAVAFEAAHRLKAMGRPPRSLVLLTVGPLDLPALFPPGAIDAYREVSRAVHRENRWREMRALSLPGFVGSAIRWGWESATARWKARIGTAPPVPWAAKQNVLDAYRPARLDGRVLLLLTERETRACMLDTPQTWAPLAEDVEIVVFPGSKERALEAPVVRALSARLREEVDRASLIERDQDTSIGPIQGIDRHIRTSVGGKPT